MAWVLVVLALVTGGDVAIWSLQVVNGQFCQDIIKEMRVQGLPFDAPEGKPVVTWEGFCLSIGQNSPVPEEPADGSKIKV